MRAWKTGVADPFAGNDDFWRSVAASVDALGALCLATVLTVLFGPVAAIAFLAPAALLLRAGLTGKRSQGQTRPGFANASDWRRAEREAVASALPRALVRRRWPQAS